MYHEQAIRGQQARNYNATQACQMNDERAMSGCDKIIGGSLIGAIRPNGALEDAIGSVAAGVDDAFHALHALADRLEPILQPECPTPAGASCGNEVSGPPVSAAVNRLRGQRAALEALVARINGVRARLDT